MVDDETIKINNNNSFLRQQCKDNIVAGDMLMMGVVLDQKIVINGARGW